MLDPSYISCEETKLPPPARSLLFAPTAADPPCSHPTKTNVSSYMMMINDGGGDDK